MVFEHLTWTGWWIAFTFGCVAGWLADKAWQLLKSSLQGQRHDSY
jgi:hypothetical protein